MMGSVSAKSPETLVQPSKPAPPNPSQAPLCPTTAPTVSHAEWDECMRKSILTIGSTTVAAIAIGLMVPAADTLLLLGTGAGVLLSIKRCRTLMRDGLLSPEQAKALEMKRRTEREEKRRQRKMEKEAKQRAAAERELEKQKKLENKNNGSKECCENLKKMLENKGISVDVPCQQLYHTQEETQLSVEKALATRSQRHEDLTPHGRTLQEDQTTNPRGSVTKVNFAAASAEVTKINQSEKSELVNRQQLKISSAEKNAKTQAKLSDIDPYSSVKLFAPYSRYLSESVVLTCDRSECTCNSEQDSNCTCDPKHLSHRETQQYTLGTDAENEHPPMKEDPANLVIQQVKSNSNDMVELESASEVQDSAPGARAGEILDSNDDGPEQSVKDQVPHESEEELEVILSPAFDSLESLNDGSSIELVVEDNEDVNLIVEDSQDGFDIEIMKNTNEDEQIAQLRNEVEGFAEPYKSESWPFSFSLPSLDKFSKKKNNSFKWPPLTSSIIVKPKRDPTCKNSEGSGTTKENKNEHNSCTCDTSNNGCTCP